MFEPEVTRVGQCFNILQYCICNNRYCRRFHMSTILCMQYIATYCSVVCNGCNMAMRDLPGMYAQSPRAYISGKSRMAMLHVPLCSHSKNTSSFNPTSNCHICLQGYKYKLLMPYGQGVECLHSPTIFR